MNKNSYAFTELVQRLEDELRTVLDGNVDPDFLDDLTRELAGAVVPVLEEFVDDNYDGNGGDEADDLGPYTLDDE